MGLEKKIIEFLSWFSVCLFLLVGCNDTRKSDTLFILKEASQTGLEFQNNLDESAEFNILNYVYYYNGGGVGVGDFNRDGLEDIYLISNLEANRLFINTGKLTFKDITTEAGVSGRFHWSTGVSVVDVNGDGWLDIYVCGLGSFGTSKETNELFINNGISEKTGEVSFTESAADYGLNVSAYSTQATFFDYDNDGDLDMYLLNHSLHSVNSYAPRAVMMQRHHQEMGDKLFRHDINNGEHRFVEITQTSGIVSTPVGFGLGVGCADFNQDGWTDIYVSNDFHENDYLLINQKGQGFVDQLEEQIGHTSKYSMGNDLADFNNDGLVDIVTLDMLPHQPEVLQKSMAEDHYALRQVISKNGYHPQLSRNTLQLNKGGRFSEIAPLAGIEASDWSWAPLFADLDNDGNKDLYITNGIYRRPNDLDYLNYTSQNAIKSVIGLKMEEISSKLIQAMPQNPISNFAFRNNGDLTFTDNTRNWGLDVLSHSNGAVYCDFDNDGDLDLVINNINEKVMLFENRASTKNNYLQVQLQGPQYNRTGVGAKVLIKHQGQTYYQEQNPARGFMSSVSHTIHTGLKENTSIDSLYVIWPGGRYQLLKDVLANQRIMVNYQNASGDFYSKEASKSAYPLFKTREESMISYKHSENEFHDVYREYLIPRLVSTEGPGMAIGDVNNDGLGDLFFTNAQGKPAKMLLQQTDGKFITINDELFKQDSIYEGVDASFFDVDGDNDQDLMVISAGNDYRNGHDYLRDRVYINEGSGIFRENKEALPKLYFNGSCARPADYDQDGDVDVFIGGRVIPGKYGLSTESYLLMNDGSGVFKQDKGFKYEGMVTDAVWADVDSNGWKDLIVVGEWMSIEIFLNNDGRLLRSAELLPTNLSGWWNCVMAEDMDNDGDVDLVVGNVGLNTKLKASEAKPVKLYVSDFDSNGSIDPVMTYFVQEEEYPFATKDVLSKQMIFLKKKFTTYASFSGITIDKTLNSVQLSDAAVREATEFRSLYLENNGKGEFSSHPLPAEANFAPIMSLASVDIDKDGLMDIVAGGNFYGLTPGMGRQDASHGLLLRNTGNGQFAPVKHTQSGINIIGQVRKIDWLKLHDGQSVLVVARNNDSPIVLQPILTAY